MPNIENPLIDPMHQIASSQQAFDGSFWRRAYRETANQGGTPQLPNPGKWLSHAAERVVPEGVVASGVISTASWLYNAPVGIPVSDLVHRLGWEPDMSVAKIGAIGVLGAVGAVSVAVEAKAFEKRKYSSSPPGTIMYVGTGKARLSSALEQTADHVWLSVLNPYVVAGVANNDPRSVADGVIGVSSTLLAWNIFWNGLIAEGKADPLVNKVKPYTDSLLKARGKLRDKIKGLKIETPVLEPIGNIDYHRAQRDFRNR